ncbi:GIY-YIG nuclease family protein [Parapedobacter lycopersici]
MYYLYILCSKSLDRYYVCSTSNLAVRLGQYNSGSRFHYSCSLGLEAWIS